MSSRNAHDLILPIGILVCVAIGVAVGSWVIRPPASATAAAPSGGPDTLRLIDSVQGLRAEIARLRTSMETTLSVPAATKRVEAVPSADTAGGAAHELREVTKELTRVAELLSHAAAHVGGDRAPLIQPRAVDPGRFERVLDLSEPKQTQTYLLWTYQQVMDELGPPDMVANTTSGLYWFYERPTGRVSFIFADGRVCRVEAKRNK